MADVSKIKLPNGTTYDIKDSGALPLTGGTITGPVIFQDTTSMDEVTIGDLVVNGNASFTNNIQANTINGVTVGSTPKFTDTITTATTTGSGNAVTAITASNGALTVTKGTTFLTSHQDISGKADKATTLAGYGITDAKIASGTITLGSNTITPLTSSSTLSAAKLSGAIPSAVTATTQSASDNSTKIATTAYVTTAIANLPEPMLFKGSVGTGGTITSLPTAAAANEGFTYKVITALTTPVTAKVGDTVISNGSEWVVIPSGDEPSGTVTSVGLTNATNGGLTISSSPITSSGNITVGHSNVLTSAQTTQAVYPIKIDKNGHISAYGSAVTIPTLKNVFGKVKVGSTTIEADTTQDTLELVAGNNITLTPDATNDKVTIGSEDEIFIATYDSTEYSDIKAAVDSSKIVFAYCPDLDHDPILSGMPEYYALSLVGEDEADIPSQATSVHVFVASDGYTMYVLECMSNGSTTTWGEPYSVTFASDNHVHGNITNAGALQTTDITIASGDKLVVTDSSDSDKVARTNLEFDGSTKTKALTKKGTFETMPDNVLIVSYNSNVFTTVSNAMNANKIIVIVYNNNTYVSCRYNPPSSTACLIYTFASTSSSSAQYVAFKLEKGSGTTIWSNYSYDLALKNSPSFSGTPTAPTASAGTNTTQIATTAFVKGAVDTALNSAITDVQAYRDTDGEGTYGWESVVTSKVAKLPFANEMGYGTIGLANDGAALNITWTDCENSETTESVPLLVEGVFDDSTLPASGVTAGTYNGGSDTKSGFYIPSFTVDSAGRITSATDLGALIPFVTPLYTSVGVLGGTQYGRLFKCYSSSPYDGYIEAGSVSKTITLPSSSGYATQVYGVVAWETSTYKPVIVDWVSSSNNTSSSITVTVSIAEATVTTIYFRLLITNSSSM